MFGFFVGWGVFWLLLWVMVWMLGLLSRHEGMQGFGILGAIFSVIYLIAVIVGRAVSGM